MYIELNLPEQRNGEWVIENYHEGGLRYQRFKKDDFVIMDNSPELVKSYADFLGQATGAVHINGLGMGLCCQYLLDKKEVTEIMVVEYDETIVKMIAPYFRKDPRCTIIHGDAYNYEPPKGKMYDFVWHDVWYFRQSKNLEDMDCLFQKYAPYAKKQDAWGREKCLALQKKESELLV